MWGTCPKSFYRAGSYASKEARPQPQNRSQGLFGNLSESALFESLTAACRTYRMKAAGSSASTTTSKRCMWLDKTACGAVPCAGREAAGVSSAGSLH